MQGIRRWSLVGMSVAALLLGLVAEGSTLAQSPGPEQARAGYRVGLQGEHSTIWIDKDTKLKKLHLPASQVWLGDVTDDVQLTFQQQLFGASPQALDSDGKKVKGKLQWDAQCTTGVATMSLGSGTANFDGSGNAYFSLFVDSMYGCQFVQVVQSHTGNTTIPAGTGVSRRLDAVKIPATSCQPSATRMCLDEGRFAVDVRWESATDSGRGIASPSGDDSGLFYFFDPTNVEMTLKVLDACNLQGFNNFWVFAAAATNVEYTLTVTDTVSGQTKQYSNPLGQPAPAILDTQAFATCP